MRPEDIKNRTFANALRGYDKSEVRSFLFKVAESSRELHEQLTATESQLAATAAVDAVDENDDDFGAGWDAAVVPQATDVPAALSGLVDADAGDAATTGPDTSSTDTATADTNTLEVGAVDADTAERALDAPAADASLAETDAPASLAAAGQSIVDRYGAIGDRIADLLRNADESAAEILAAAENDSAATRAAAEAEAAQVRTDAEERASQLLAEAQSIRTEADAYRDEMMAELANARLDQETALQEARAAAEADVETFRVDSIEEINVLRSDAFAEIEALRNGANTEVADLRAVAQTDADGMREAAIASATAATADDEAEAARLREEAESDRLAARAELEDVRSEVSTLLEQARTQSEFIKQEADEIIRTKVRANFEQAQARIDVLRNTEVASRERIVLAQTELAGALTRLEAEPLPVLDPTDSPAVIEEAERRHDELGVGGAADAIEANVVDEDVVEVGTVDDTTFEQSVFEADVATAAQELEDDSLANYFGSDDQDQDQTTGGILAASFGDTADSTDESVGAGWPMTEVNEVESVEYETVSPAAAESDSTAVGDPAGETNATIDAFGVAEPVQYGDLPVRGEAPTEVDAFHGSESFGAASLSEALPSDSDDPEFGGVTQEDALARLVREAMQEAVDSARKTD